MGIADLTPGRSTVALSAALAHRPPARAVVAQAPLTVDGPLFVYLPDVSQTDLVGPCKWSADRGSTLPAVGANALVVWDNTGAPVIVWWQGTRNDIALDSGRIGATMSWTGTTVPDDYVVADGRTLVGTDYPDAYAFAQAEAAAGNPLWTADTGAGTFTVPDLSDKFIYGPGALSLGDTGGESTHVLTPAETAMKAHDHGGVTGNENANHNHNYTFPVTWATIDGGSFTNVAAVGGTTTTGVENQNHGHAIPSETAADGAAHNNMPPYVVLAQLVKVLGVTITAGALQGPTGPAGTDGTNGTDGADGAYTTVQLTTLNDGAQTAGRTTDGNLTAISANPYYFQQSASSSDPVLINFTPTVDCWWDVDFSTILLAEQAAWDRADICLELTAGTDARGATFNKGRFTIHEGHSSVSWVSPRATARFKLTAGTAYTVKARLQPGAGTSWGYYYGSSYMEMKSAVVGFW